MLKYGWNRLPILSILRNISPKWNAKIWIPYSSQKRLIMIHTYKPKRFLEGRSSWTLDRQTNVNIIKQKLSGCTVDKAPVNRRRQIDTSQNFVVSAISSGRSLLDCDIVSFCSRIQTFRSTQMDPEDGYSTFLQNVGIHLQDYTALQRRRP
jgi:hypothetical protein